MHTNIFEFSREHEVMKTSYVREDPDRSYCGLIMVYNFWQIPSNTIVKTTLDTLIGRVFINKDKHYFIEGKGK